VLDGFLRSDEDAEYQPIHHRSWGNPSDGGDARTPETVSISANCPAREIDAAMADPVRAGKMADMDMYAAVLRKAVRAG